MSDYSNILSPIRIGTHVWKNRVVKGPSSTLFAGPDQYCSDRLTGPYEAMAKGGAAAVILGAGICDDPKLLIEEETSDAYPFGYRGYPFLGLYDDKFIPGLKKLTDATHRYGCEAIVQIFQNAAALETKGGAWCASTFTEEELPSPEPYCFPTRGLTLDEIAAWKERYLAAAQRAQQAGFDGVEVHAANGYLILSFVSRVWNHRDDQYGCQNMENRTRLACELIAGIKERCGEDFIVGVRMNGQEFGHPDAITLEEGGQIAEYLERAGADYISVTGYGYGPVPFQYAADYWQYPEPDPDMKQYLPRLKEGIMVEPAANVKRHVSVPVFGIGSLTAEKADKLIGEGKFDIGLMARGLWADPEIANKLKAGHPEDIRRCNHCGTCDDLNLNFLGGERIIKRCRVNPAFGREAELTPKPAAKPKKVLVVGGGVAGLEAARVAAQRGHHVTLCEKKAVLALEPALATMVKGTTCEDVPALTSWLIDQAEKQDGLEIRMKTEVTPALVKEMNPDAIVVANGWEYDIPQIDGIDSKIVTTIPDLMKLAEKPLRVFGPQAINKLSEVALPGIKKDCVIIGAQIEAIQGAIFLLKRGKNVTIVDDVDAVGERMPGRYLGRSLPYLERHGVDIYTGVTYGKIDKRGIEFTTKEGERKRLDCGSVLVFKSPKENTALYDSLEGLAPEVYAVGSCTGTDHSLMVDAMAMGREVACKL